jgi:hypothetical protein
MTFGGANEDRNIPLKIEQYIIWYYWQIALYWNPTSPIYNRGRLQYSKVIFESSWIIRFLKDFTNTNKFWEVSSQLENHQ